MRRGESKGKGPTKRRARAPTGTAKSKTRSRRKTSAPTLAEQLAVKTRELDEALQQQAATADVLKVISSSAGDLQPVFKSILANATRICRAEFGTLGLVEGDAFRNVALHNVPPEVFPNELFHPHPKSGLAYMLRTRRISSIKDLRTEPPYLEGHPAVVALADIGGARSIVNVPMVKDDKLIGVIGIYRQVVQPFSDKEVDLVQSFASQAVIAIENTRLLTELRELLERQTATSEVLQVISGSPGNIEPVFETLLANATRLCDARFGILFQVRDGVSEAAAVLGDVPPKLRQFLQRKSLDPSPASALGRIIATKQIVHIADITEDPAYIARDPYLIAITELSGTRSLLAVPMLKDNELIGAIAVYRTEVRPFSDKQVDLLTNFAKQAVIAVQNTRLLKDLRQRTDDLTEALEQQTATSEVLQVISSSPGELEPVFETMLANATRLCEASYGALWFCEADAFWIGAFHGPLPAAYTESWQRRTSYRIGSETPLARVAKSHQAIQVSDMRESSA
jgi:GAF domain-containing protein